MVGMEDIEDMEAMDITVARGLLMLRLSLDSMEDIVEDTMVDTVALDMVGLAIVDRFICG